MARLKDKSFATDKQAIWPNLKQTTAFCNHISRRFDICCDCANFLGEYLLTFSKFFLVDFFFLTLSSLSFVLLIRTFQIKLTICSSFRLVFHSFSFCSFFIRLVWFSCWTSASIDKLKIVRNNWLFVKDVRCFEWKPKLCMNISEQKKLSILQRVYERRKLCYFNCNDNFH